MFDVELGTALLHQLLAVFQSVFVLPIQMALIELQSLSPM